MSPEAFTACVREYCEWADAPSHDLDTGHRLLLRLVEGGRNLNEGNGLEPRRDPLGMAKEVPWSETKRFADLPFQVYPASFWPEVHPEGQFTDNIHEDLARIYTELRHGLQFLDQGDVESAIKYWRDSFIFHWGHHASAAAWAIEHHKRGG